MHVINANTNFNSRNDVLERKSDNHKYSFLINEIDELKKREKTNVINNIDNKHQAERESMIVNKMIWVSVIVFLLTICLFLILKFSIDLANSSKVELIKMKDSYSRLITEQLLLQQSNLKIVLD